MLFAITLMLVTADPSSSTDGTGRPTPVVAPRIRFVAEESVSPQPARSARKLEAVASLEQRLKELKKKLSTTSVAPAGSSPAGGEKGDDDEDGGEWVADRARLEMQLATARLEYATALLDEACKQSDPEVRRKAVLSSLRKVQEVDRTLDMVNIERLDDYDRRAYRGLTAMRHRVSSMQIYALLKITGDAPSTPPDFPEKPKPTPGGVKSSVTNSPCLHHHRCRVIGLFTRR